MSDSAEGRSGSADVLVFPANLVLRFMVRGRSAQDPAWSCAIGCVTNVSLLRRFPNQGPVPVAPSIKRSYDPTTPHDAPRAA